ncbi:segregation and condensation protein A [Candidatus Hepatoplasma crinochetorum]|uniref:segregation and condensation protein A n=1 Tax=Candidatus Hepatoplasma crinochetorum TaxID=295596 RepID=UPI0030893C7E|nr:MAG: segregation and condensation protein A [Candidatus Hepatoplasma crinochetorum]
MIKKGEFKIDNYEGPLDLLLELIKSKKMNITEISLVEIADQFVQIVNNLEIINLDLVSEYFLLASQLLDYKAKYLLAIEEGKDFAKKIELSEEDLLQRLIIYESYKKASKRIYNLYKNNFFFSKKDDQLEEFLFSNTDKRYQLVSKGVIDIEKAIDRIYKILEKNKQINTTLTIKRISIEERKKELLEILDSNKKTYKFTQFINNNNFSRYIIAVTLICFLEMAANDQLILKQINDFSEILIERKNL